MSERQWPYNLPIWRTSHRAVSPDGKLVATIDPARELSMSNPTSGILCVSNGLHNALHIERCSPSFIWSDDSRYLAVPHDNFFFRRHRLLVIDFEKRQTYATKKAVWYYQPESFEGGRLVATINPSRKRRRRVEFRIPDELTTAFYRYVWVSWPEMVQQGNAAVGGSDPNCYH